MRKETSAETIQDKPKKRKKNTATPHNSIVMWKKAENKYNGDVVPCETGQDHSLFWMVEAPEMQAF